MISLQNDLRVSSLVKHKLYDEYTLFGIVTCIQHKIVYVTWFFPNTISHNIAYSLADKCDISITYLEIVNR